MVEALTEWKAGKPANEWIALNVMGWKYERFKGQRSPFVWKMPDGFHDTKVPNYTGSVAADYEVLCRVRDTWSFEQVNDFDAALMEMWARRWQANERDAFKDADYALYYREGDYSEAAWRALTGK